MRRILIIDDEDEIREIVALSLRAAAGWTVETAGSGAEGLLLAAAHRPDAILLDVSMPGMDGLATLRQVQADAALRDVPVIFLTGRAMNGRFAELGAAAVLAKPFDPRTLAQQVDVALRWS